MKKQLLFLVMLLATSIIQAAPEDESYYVNLRQGVSDGCKKLCPNCRQVDYRNAVYRSFNACRQCCYETCSRTGLTWDDPPPRSVRRRPRSARQR